MLLLQTLFLHYCANILLYAVGNQKNSYDSFYYDGLEPKLQYLWRMSVTIGNLYVFFFLLAVVALLSYLWSTKLVNLKNLKHNLEEVNV